MEAGVCIAYLVGKFVEDAGIVRGVASLGKPGNSIVGKRDEDVFAGFLHLGVKTHRPIRTYGEFAPGEFVDVGVPETGEAGEHKSRLDVIIGPVFGFDIILTSSSVRKARDFSSALGLKLASMDLPGFLSMIPSRLALLRATITRAKRASLYTPLSLRGLSARLLPFLSKSYFSLLR